MSRRVTKEWSIDVDDTFKHRIENGALVFWKPGRTIYIIVWNLPEGEDKQQTLTWLISESNPHPLLR